MKFTVFVLCCVLQSIAAVNWSELIMYPPHEKSSRVVGGKDAAEGDAPYQCSLQVGTSHECGCAILSEQWIITAAHCLAGYKPENLRIVVGTIDLKNGGTAYQLEKLISHEGYNTPRFANDVGLIKVKGSIELNDKVQKIELLKDDVPDGAELKLTGWGRLRAGGANPQILQIINLNAVQTNRCKQIFGERYVHGSHICTLTKKGEGTCGGDSGGPLVFDNKLVGLVNFGVPCAMGYPDAHAKVSFLYDWVQKQLAAN